MTDDPIRQRPPDASDELVEACGLASEALEYIERARGHLYSMHQLMGHADLVLGDAADKFDEDGRHDVADRLRRELVGRNVLDGRWTFQIVEEFDQLYYEVVRGEVRRLEADHMGGLRHVYESELKEQRRTRGRVGHEERPPTAHDDRVEVE